MCVCVCVCVCVCAEYRAGDRRGGINTAVSGDVATIFKGKTVSCHCIRVEACDDVLRQLPCVRGACYCLV